MVTACGGSEEAAEPAPAEEAAEAAPAEEAAAEEEAAPAEEAAAEPEVTTAEDGAAELTIGATDAMQYSHNRFTVKAGQKVRLTLQHTGSLPKTAMGHNIIILKAGVDLAEFAGLAQGAGPDKEYFPEGGDAQIVAKSTVIGGGDSTVVEFTAPEAGEYDFFCSFPGHWNVMKGKMVVAAAE